MQRLVWPASLVVALGGCATAHSPAPKEAAIACPVANPVMAITASDRANASTTGQGRPVQVRVYQLKSDSRLVVAKFEDVWQSDATVFATDLVKVEEITIYPGETKLLKVVPSPDAHTLAAVALFREPQGKSWFLSYELASPRKDPPCPPGEPRIPVWLDRMSIEDGQGRATGPESPATSTSSSAGPAAPKAADETKGH